jgi:hypothetical protein
VTSKKGSADGQEYTTYSVTQSTVRAYRARAHVRAGAQELHADRGQFQDVQLRVAVRVMNERREDAARADSVMSDEISILLLSRTTFRSPRSGPRCRSPARRRSRCTSRA